MAKTITLDADETDRLLRCMMRAIELGRDTHNYDVEVMADECTNMLLEKWGIGDG